MYRRQLLRAAGCTLLTTCGASAVAAQSADYEPLGVAPVNRVTESVVDSAGQTAFVATQDGFAVVDISEPESPTLVESREELVAEHDDGPMREILDVAVADDRLLVAGPANHQDQPVPTGFLLYDVSEPQNPERIAFHETDYPIHNAFLTGEYAYLVDSTRMVVVDVTGRPQQVGAWQPQDFDPAWADVHPLIRFAHDLFVHENRAYVVEWDAGTFVLDISDPENPSGLSRIGGRSPEELASISEQDVLAHSLGMPGNHHSVAVNDDQSVLVLNKEAWRTRLTDEAGVDPLGEVELWDISQERNPTIYATIEAPRSRAPTKSEINTTPHNFDIVGDRLYTSWYDGGVQVHDISNPAAPELLAWWRAPERWTFWTAQYATEEYFVASSHTRGQYNNGKGALVTFPNRPGEQPSPPPLTTPSDPNAGRSDTQTPPKTDTGQTQTPTPATPGTPPAETATQPDPTSTPTQTATEAADETGAGFGVLAALGGVTAGAWRLYTQDAE